jgi:hypothetical protein
MYKGFKLIFCGDIGFQAEPIGGDEINMKSFQHISEFKNNHRTNDLDLLNNLNGMRECITNNTTYDCNHLRQIGISDVITIYDEKDICLTYTKEKRKGYDVLKGEKYLITVSNDKYNRGDIVYVMPKGKIYEKTNAFTTHSVQGETFYNKIFIDIEIIYSNNLRLLYTAISRAKKIDQIYIVNDVKSVKIEKPKVEKPKVEKPNVKEEVEEEDLYALYNQEKEEKKEDPTTNALTYWFSKSIRAGNF